MGSQTNLAIALHEQINTDLAGLKSDQVKAVLDYQLASSLAYALPLPASAALTDSALGGQWEAKHARPVAKFLDDINRDFMIDYSTIIRMAQAIWVFRYRIAYEPCYLHASLSRALCAAKVIPGDVAQTLLDIGTCDTGSLSALHVSGDAMSMIEQKRRKIEQCFKECYGTSTAFAGNESSDNPLVGMLRRSKMTAIAAAIESIDRDGLSDGEQEAMLNRLNGELDRQLAKDAKIDAIRYQIARHGKMSRTVVAALESLEPGIITKHPKASKVRYTNSESDVGVVAALEAINWAKIGKWGFIGAIVAFMVALVAKCVSYIRKGTAAARAIDGQDLTKEEQDRYMERVAELVSGGSPTSMAINSAIMELNTRRLSNWMVDIGVAEDKSNPKKPDALDIAIDDALDGAKKFVAEKKAAQDAAKKSVEADLKVLGPEVTKAISVSPTVPNTTVERDDTLNKRLEGTIGKSTTAKVSGFSSDTKLALERFLKKLYQDPSKVEFEQFMKDLTAIEGGLKSDHRGEGSILSLLAKNGKAGTKRHQYPFVYGDLGANRLALANGALWFSLEMVEELKELLEDAESSDGEVDLDQLKKSIEKVDKQAGLSASLSQLNMSSLSGASEDKLTSQLDKVAKQLTEYSVQIKSVSDSFKSESISFTNTMRADAETLEKYLQEGVQKYRVEKVDLSDVLGKLSKMEGDASKAGDKEKLAALAKTRSVATSIISSMKSIEAAAVSMLMFAEEGIRAYNTDLKYLASFAMTSAEVITLFNRDKAYAEQLPQSTK